MQRADRVPRSRIQVPEIRRVGPARPQPGHRARRDRGNRRPHGQREEQSGGRRQRLALARAVLGDPPVLVLDDPLSSVDVHTEAVIEQSLARVLDGVTALLVVHRPSTLALADRVALVDGGKVVATGTHSELLKSNDLYRALLSQEFEPVESSGRATA